MGDHPSADQVLSKHAVQVPFSNTFGFLASHLLRQLISRLPMNRNAWIEETRPNQATYGLENPRYLGGCLVFQRNTPGHAPLHYWLLVP